MPCSLSRELIPLNSPATHLVAGALLGGTDLDEVCVMLRFAYSATCAGVLVSLPIVVSEASAQQQSVQLPELVIETEPAPPAAAGLDRQIWFLDEGAR